MAETEKITTEELLIYVEAMSRELAVLAERAGQTIPAYHLRLAANELLWTTEATGSTPRAIPKRRPPCEKSSTRWAFHNIAVCRDAAAQGPA